jgi:ribonuclease BN (tRNA processing enzyme)
MILTVLGSGYGRATARRATAGYLVEWSGRALLMDPSAGTYGRALKSGLDPAVLDAVLLTHHHPDHTSDLAAILWARRKEGIDSELSLAGPPGTDRLLDAVRAIDPTWYGAPCRVVDYPLERTGLLVTSYPADHTGGAVCLRLVAQGKALAYSGDTADCDGLREACRDVDLALLECTANESTDGHMTPQDCEAVVRATGARRALLTHLGPAVDAALPLAEDGLVETL